MVQPLQMKIAILATGTQGDVQPYVALGGALQRAGHAVRLLTNENFAGIVRAARLEFHAMRGDAQAALESPEMRAALARGNFLEIRRHSSKLLRSVIFDWAQDGLAACQETQLLVAGLGGLFLGRALSEKLRVPLVEAFVVPFSATREFPAALFPAGVGRFGGAVNRLTHHLFRQIMWQGFRAGDRAVRAQVLGLPPAPFFGPPGWRGHPAAPVLHGISPSVLPRPADWNPDTHLTGYWFLDPPAGWQPPAALEDFLRAGPPPVYIGFGSMGSRDPEQTAALALEALAHTGRRAVLLKGWGGMLPATLPGDVYLSEAVPHAWLFPRMAAVVHHGGAGTTAAGLRAGVPNVVVPFFGDQPFWGWRVAALGVGPAPIPRKTLDAGQLARAIQTATTDQAMKDRAVRLGSAIRAEDGLHNAVGLIEDYGRRDGLMAG